MTETSPRTTSRPAQLRVRSPRDLLAVVPFMLGYAPANSLLAISIRSRPGAPVGDCGLLIRFDLPSSWASADAIADAASLVAEKLSGDGAHRAVLVAYTDDVVRHAHLLDAVQNAVRGAGIDLLDTFQVASTGWRSTMCDDPRCCPPQGRPLADLQSSELAAELVLRGEAVAADRNSRLDCLDVRDVARARAVTTAVRAARRRPAAGRRDAAFSAWQAALSDALSQAQTADPGGCDELDQAPAVAILAAVEDLVLRDALLMDAVAAGTVTGPQDAARLAAVFGGEVPPDPERIQAALQVVRSLVRSCVGPVVAEPLAMLAWLTWWSGDLGLARDVAERALMANPAQSMALLVADLAAVGLPPEWVTRRRRC